MGNIIELPTEGNEYLWVFGFSVLSDLSCRVVALFHNNRKLTVSSIHKKDGSMIIIRIRQQVVD